MKMKRRQPKSKVKRGHFVKNVLLEIIKFRKFPFEIRKLLKLI